jgi:mannosyltransferase
MTATLRTLLPSELPSEARTRRAAVAAWLPSAVALVLGALGLTGPALWRDEAVSWTVAQESTGQILRLTGNVDAVHEVYYLLLHVLFRLGGPSPALLRAPSVLAVTAAAWCVAATARRLAGPRAGLLAGLSWACVPLVSRYAQEGRSFALVSAAVAASAYLLVRAVQASEEARRTEVPGAAGWWTAYAAAVVVAGLLNVMALLSVPAFAVTMALWRPSRGTVLGWAAASAAGALGTLPIVLRAVGQTGDVSWLTAPTWRTPLDLAIQFAGGAAALPLVVAAVLFALPYRSSRRAEGRAAGRAERRGGGRRGLAALALPLALLPPGVLLLVSLDHPLYQPRYVLYSLAGISLLVGAGWDAAAARIPLGFAATTGIALAAVAGTAALGVPAQVQLRQADGHGTDFRGLAGIVADHARPGDGVVFASLSGRSIEFAYPRDFARTTDVALADAFNPAKPDGLEYPARTVAVALGGYRRVWIVSSGHSDSRPGSRDAVLWQAVTTGRHPDGTWTLDGQTVQLWASP